MAFDVSRSWHYVKNGEAAGPVPADELQRMAAGGLIRPQTLVWNPTLPNWIEAGSFEELFPSAPVPPPLPVENAPAPLRAAPMPAPVDPEPAFVAADRPLSPTATAAAFADLGPTREEPSADWSETSLEPRHAAGAEQDTSGYDPEPELHFAGFWIRTAAWLIDAVIITALFWSLVQFTTIDDDLRPLTAGLIPMDQIDLAIALAEQQGVTIFNRAMFQEATTLSAISGVLAALYFVLMHWTLQATLGKFILGIRLITRGGDNIGFLRSLWRYLMSFLSAALALLGYVMIAVTPQKTGLHDILSGTRVVYRASL